MAANEEFKESRVHPKNTLNRLTGKEWVKSTVTWFSITTRKRTEKELRHPSKYPEELCSRFIGMFTRPGDLVVDPFLGTGSTLREAKRMGRNGFGIELVKEFVETAREKLREPSLLSNLRNLSFPIIHGDSRNFQVFAESFEIKDIKLVMTSPPYSNMLRQFSGKSNSTHKDRQEKGLPVVFSDLEEDIGNAKTYEEGLDLITEVLISIKPYMAHRSFLVIVAQNYRDKNGIYRTFSWDLAFRLSNEFHFLGEQIWCQKNKKAYPWAYPYNYVPNVHHHTVLIFSKQR